MAAELSVPPHAEPGQASSLVAVSTPLPLTASTSNHLNSNSNRNLNLNLSLSLLPFRSSQSHVKLLEPPRLPLSREVRIDHDSRRHPLNTAATHDLKPIEVGTHLTTTPSSYAALNMSTPKALSLLMDALYKGSSLTSGNPPADKHISIVQEPASTPEPRKSAAETLTVKNNADTREERDKALPPMAGDVDEVDDDATGTDDHSSSRKRKIGGRPRAGPAKRPRTNGPTRLRKGRAVASKVPMDVWELILSHCPGKFLAKARRINKSFHRALSYESVWKRNRLQVHGPDLPDPFPGMREDEYANLLEGLGCMECGNPKTRKTYWPWQKRWCADCLQKNTVKEDAAMSLLRGHRDLLDDCIPYGAVDSWGNYEMAGDYDRSWARQGHGRQKIYSKADITDILCEYEEVSVAGHWKTAGGLEEWLATKRAARDEAMDRIQKIENWVETKTRGKLGENTQLKLQRAEYFQKLAGELDPPIQPEALALIQAYKRAVDIPRAPSDRAWKALKPKLEKDRDAAQAAIDLQRQRASRDDRDKVEQAEYLRRMTRRSDGATPEQRTLATIADVIMKELDESCPPVADADYGLLALRKVRERYFDQTFVGEIGPGDCKLLLEDARWIWEKKIVPKMDGWGPRRSRAAQLFKCPGCSRNDVNLRHTFEGLFCHLRRKHSPALGDFHSLFREGLEAITSFHWLNIEWPTNLPILADHHTASGKWDPNDSSPYICAPPSDPSEVYGLALDGRRVLPGLAGADAVVDNIIYAGSELRGVVLDPALKTRIAICYAAQTYEYHHKAPLPSNMECIAELPLELIRARVYDLFDHFRCAVCLERNGPPRGMTKLHSPQTLIDHFRRWHAPDRHWAWNMIRLPSDSDLWRTLSKPGMEKALEVFNKLFPLSTETPRRDDSIPHAPKPTSDPLRSRAALIMAAAGLGSALVESDKKNGEDSEVVNSQNDVIMSDADGLRDRGV